MALRRLASITTHGSPALLHAVQSATASMGNRALVFRLRNGRLGERRRASARHGLLGLGNGCGRRGRGAAAGGVPRTVSSVGGKYYFDDDQEWPDTLMVTYYDYGGRLLNSTRCGFGLAIRLGRGIRGSRAYGDKGYIIIGNGSWRAYALQNKLVAEGKSSADDEAGVPHMQNFFDCMRSRNKPAADLETVGHPSSMLCHVGNALRRLGRSVEIRSGYPYVRQRCRGEQVHHAARISQTLDAAEAVRGLGFD